MAAKTTRTENVLSRSGEAQELARVYRELEETRRRLDEETAYYRAELESLQRRQDRDSTLLQADEVARRRRIEGLLHSTQAELSQAQVELADLTKQNEQLRRALAEQEAEQARREQVLLADERQSAREAWREAEREVALQERELEALRQLLTEEQQARQQAVALAARREQEAAQAQQAEQDASKLVVSLKKALWNTAHARRQAETALLELRTANQSPAAEPENPIILPADNSNELRTGDDGYNEVSQEALKTVFFGDLSADLTDDFRLTAADASLDKETVGQLRAVQAQPAAVEDVVVQQAPPVAAVANSMPTAKPPIEPPVQRAAAPLLAAAPGRQGLQRVLLLLSGAVALATAGYWLLVGGGLGHILNLFAVLRL